MGYRPTGYPRMWSKGRLKLSRRMGIQFKLNVKVGKEIKLDESGKEL